MNFSRREYEAVKQIDLLSYLFAMCPQNLRIEGEGYKWSLNADLVMREKNWTTSNNTGTTAFEYLALVEKIPKQKAVEHLLLTIGESLPFARDHQTLYMPPRHDNYNEAYKYLSMQGIYRDVINYCFYKNIIYEDRRFHNCVFVGRDAQGRARHASICGNHGSFKRCLSGSDLTYGFCITPLNEGRSNTLFVFDSPIDTLQYASYLSWSHGSGWESIYYLSLNDKSPEAAKRFLKEHDQISYIEMHLKDRTMNSTYASLIDQMGLINGKDRVIRSYEHDPHLNSWRVFTQFQSNEIQRYNQDKKRGKPNFHEMEDRR